MPIESDLQYGFTKREALRFREAIAALEADTDGKPGWMEQIQLNALRAQLDDLEAQMAEYTASREPQGPG
jgi:hypothetical protein